MLFPAREVSADLMGGGAERRRVFGGRRRNWSESSKRVLEDCDVEFCCD